MEGVSASVQIILVSLLMNRIVVTFALVTQQLYVVAKITSVAFILSMAQEGKALKIPIYSNIGALGSQICVCLFGSSMSRS